MSHNRTFLSIKIGTHIIIIITEKSNPDNICVSDLVILYSGDQID
jgi:hypothetical protein